MINSRAFFILVSCFIFVKESLTTLYLLMTESIILCSSFFKNLWVLHIFNNSCSWGSLIMIAYYIDCCIWLDLSIDLKTYSLLFTTALSLFSTPLSLYSMFLLKLRSTELKRVLHLKLSLFYLCELLPSLRSSFFFLCSSRFMSNMFFLKKITSFFNRYSIARLASILRLISSRLLLFSFTFYSVFRYSWVNNLIPQRCCRFFPCHFSLSLSVFIARSSYCWPFFLDFSFWSWLDHIFSWARKLFWRPPGQHQKFLLDY